MKKISFLIISFQFFALSLVAQQIVEGIVAVIGDKAIFKSEVEQQYLQLKVSDLKNNNLRCEVMQELMFQKLLIHHAEVDSLVVTDVQVNDAIDQRLEYFISQIGSEKKLEEYFDKTISQIREEFQTIFREQLLAQRMESKITSNLRVTPQEVFKFYNNIPKDSLPIFPEEIYFLSTLPSEININSIILIALCSIITTSIVSIYPASRAAKLDTIQTLKYE